MMLVPGGLPPTSTLGSLIDQRIDGKGHVFSDHDFLTMRCAIA